MDILVADDSSAMRMMIVRTLRQAGISADNITQAGDGVEAFDAVCKKVPDLILCDWNMPNMNGIDFLEKLRAENIGVTFGFITTEATADMRKRATDAGAKFLIAKPFTLDSFEKVIKAFF